MLTTMDLSKAEVHDSYVRLLQYLPGAIYRSEIILDETASPPTFTTRLKYVSEGMFRLLGRDSDNIRYDCSMLATLIPSEDLESIYQAIYRSILTGEQYKIMYRIKMPDNTQKWIWEQGTAVRGAPGEPMFIEGLMMDFSEHKNYELRLEEENRRMQDSIDAAYGFRSIVGKSPAMRRVYELIKKAAASGGNVIIYGETGSGKDKVAQTIHELSGKKGPYVPVNCGAIPVHLMESEFFGHVKGAFSGALTSRDGFIGAANNGTLFLDEVGELSPDLQTKLLRVLENKTYTPVGSNTPKTSTFRLIAATNQNLPNMVQANRMRLDFYYRINVLAIPVPPLRERKGDIPLLAAAYLQRHNIDLSLSPHVLTAMENYSWPGNVRELHNFLERYVTFGHEALASLRAPAGETPLPPQPDIPLQQALDELEYRLVHQAMENAHWKQAPAALALGLTLRTLQRKLKKLGIH